MRCLDLDFVNRFIEVPHRIGCEFSLDDFGSGLGSFSSLKHEQVEHQEDFDWLRDSGVDFVLGHFIEAPEKLGKATTTGTYRILNP